MRIQYLLVAETMEEDDKISMTVNLPWIPRMAGLHNEPRTFIVRSREEFDRVMDCLGEADLGLKLS